MATLYWKKLSQWAMRRAASASPGGNTIQFRHRELALVRTNCVGLDRDRKCREEANPDLTLMFRTLLRWARGLPRVFTSAF